MALGSLATFLCLQTCRKAPQRLGIILSTYCLTFQGQFTQHTSGLLICGALLLNSAATCSVLAP